MQSIEINSLVKLVEEVGRKLLRLSVEDEIEIRMKADLSPVIEADMLSNAILRRGLLQQYPDIPIISEESDPPPFHERLVWDYCWILDPLDGTKEYIAKNGRYSINLALIKRGRPVFGLISNIVDQETIWCLEGKSPMIKQNGEIRPLETVQHDGHLRIAISRFNTTEDEFQYFDFLKERGVNFELIPLGASLKQTEIVKGNIDIHVKFGRSYEWDVAAGDLLIAATGGAILNYNTMTHLKYNKMNFINPPLIMFNKRYYELYKQGKTLFKEFKFNKI